MMPGNDTQELRTQRQPMGVLPMTSSQGRKRTTTQQSRDLVRVKKIKHATVGTNASSGFV